MSRCITSFSILVIAASFAAAQGRQVLPLRYGNVFTYWSASQARPQRILLMRDRSDPDRNDARDTVRVQEWRWGGVWRQREVANYLTVNGNGNAVLLDPPNSGWTELHPVLTPLADTFTLKSSYGWNDTVRHVVTRRFDTTLYGRSVRAFSFFSPSTVEARVKLETTVAEGIGVIRTVNLDTRDVAALHSCIIDGQSYNWEHQYYRFMELCDGNIYQFHYHGRDFMNNPFDYHPTIRFRADTVVNGRQYYQTTTGRSLHQSDSGVFALERGSQTRVTSLLPGNATIGTATDAFFGSFSRPGVVVDTGTSFYAGRDRRRLEIALEQDIGEGVPHTEIWLEGIGFFAYDDFDTSWPNEFSLNYANICGSSIGSYVQAVSYDRGEDRIPGYLVNYPNPFSPASGTVVRFLVDGATARHAVLRVHDTFGRCVATLLDESMMPGEHVVRFNSTGFSPGVYLFSLQTGERIVSRTMIAVE